MNTCFLSFFLSRASDLSTRVASFHWPEGVMRCFIDPRVRKIRNEASSCLGIFSRALHFLAPPVPPPAIFMTDTDSWVIDPGLFWFGWLSHHTWFSFWFGWRCFVTVLLTKGRGRLITRPEVRIFSRTLRFYHVASSPGSPLPHLLDGRRGLVLQCRSYGRIQCNLFLNQDGVWNFSNERRFSLESSLFQGISLNSLLLKWNQSSIVM